MVLHGFPKNTKKKFEKQTIKIKKSMKKFLVALVCFLLAATASSQSVQWHQSYDGNQKLVADFFWSNDNFNVYSYNEFTLTQGRQAVGYSVLYGEYRIAKSHFLAHAEGRLRLFDFPLDKVPTAMYFPAHNDVSAGFAYELCAKEWTFYFTPMYRYDFGGIGHNWQFSINSSAEYDKFYYEGYIDMWGPTTFNFCTEQKFYYKITQNFQIGANLMLFNINDPELKPMSVRGDGKWNFQPWLVFRIAL